MYLNLFPGCHRNGCVHRGGYSWLSGFLVSGVPLGSAAGGVAALGFLTCAPSSLGVGVGLAAGPCGTIAGFWSVPAAFFCPAPGLAAFFFPEDGSATVPLGASAEGLSCLGTLGRRWDMMSAARVGVGPVETAGVSSAVLTTTRTSSSRVRSAAVV